MVHSTRYKLVPEQPTDFFPPGGEDEICFTDAYSQWSAGIGSKYDLVDRLTTEGGEDYNFYAYLTGLLGGIETFSLSQNAFRCRSRSERPVLRARSRDERTGQADPKSGLLARLPLRAAAVNGDYQPNPTQLNELSFADRSDDLDPGSAHKPADKIVVLGIIDDAINFLHDRFQSGDGKSRIDSVWVQDADWAGQGFLPFGREFSNRDINALLAERKQSSDLELLQSVGVVGTHAKGYHPSALQFGGSHGTHIADLAAGYDGSDSAEQDTALFRRMMCVQLPLLATLDTSGHSLIGLIIEAARHIFKRAFAQSCHYGSPLPVVINLSYGFRGGPRNGLHPVERALRALSIQYRKDCIAQFNGVEPSVEVVLPAGNGHLSLGQAAPDAASGDGSQELAVTAKIKRDDRTPTFIEVWAPRNTESVRLKLTLPGSEELPSPDPAGWITLSRENLEQAWLLTQSNAGNPDDDQAIGRIKMDSPNEMSMARADCDPTGDNTHWRILVALAPTECHDVRKPVAPVGHWTLRAEAKLSAGQSLHAWIQRDEPVSGFASGAQQAQFADDVYEANSRLENGAFRVVDVEGQTVRRDGTLSGIASEPSSSQLDDEASGGVQSKPSISVAGYVWQTQDLAIYSAAALTGREGPVVAAVSDRSPVSRGVLAAGTNSGSSYTQPGTSVAAPQVTRVLADQMAVKRSGFNGAEFLLNTSNSDASTDARTERLRGHLLPFGKLGTEGDIRGVTR
ncbi:MAG: S8 family serine peptidase [Pseudomonadota bacterium]